MIRPKKQARVIRLIKYFYAARKLIFFFKNWYVLPLNYLGILNISGGYTLKLYNGLYFKIAHFLDALTIQESFLDHEYRLPQNLKNKQPVILDIGANIGSFSIYAAQKFPQVKILSFEPSFTTFKLLCQNIKTNKLADKIIPHQLAVWDKNTSLKLFSSGPSGLKSIFRARQEKKFETVKTITLTKIFKKYKINHCDYLKIDCEGAEYSILNSCPPKIFNKIKYISLEFHELTPDQDHLQLIKILKKNNFRVTCRYHHIENTIGYIRASHS